jgi:hypothetical protein
MAQAQLDPLQGDRVDQVVVDEMVVLVVLAQQVKEMLVAPEILKAAAVVVPVVPVVALLH